MKQNCSHLFFEQFWLRNGGRLQPRVGRLLILIFLDFHVRQFELFQDILISDLFTITYHFGFQSTRLFIIITTKQE
jgi:hypothetical protein